jgi:selT/selW/selH-like putative selenoprotein|tara:strand:+ start:838 stop:1002 length:165 start_codon:yes stop_codon:yes gene_type:complete
LAAELSKDLDVAAELCADGKGIFDILVDGKLIYSKYETGRFPEPGEVTKLIGSD